MGRRQPLAHSAAFHLEPASGAKALRQSPSLVYQARTPPADTATKQPKPQAEHPGQERQQRGTRDREQPAGDVEQEGRSGRP